MIVTWTTEQVLALAPDSGSIKRGKSLAIASKWPLLGRSDIAVWGECKGSGKKPYRTQIDLSDAATPAFRCSCPSRKFPCKHSLGLFLLFVEQEASFQSVSESGDPPDWVAEWLAKRSQSAAQKQEKRKKAAADPVAQAKRADQRAAKIEAGLIDLNQWLEDIIRQGLATLPQQPYSFWDQAAARLVDAQAPGLATRVRKLAGIPHSGHGWPERMLKALGKIHLLVQGYQHQQSLPPALRAEVRSQLGWSPTQAELRSRLEQSNPLVSCITDDWYVLGKYVIEEDNLKTQRVWLWGETSQTSALVLTFAHGRQPLDISLSPGTCVQGNLIFYPGTGIQRAVVESLQEAKPFSRLPSKAFHPSIDRAISHYATMVGQNPWGDRLPLSVASVIPRDQDNQWWLIDHQQNVLPIASNFSQGWTLLAISGGYPCTVFGEWDGAAFLPLSVWAHERGNGPQFFLFS
ncbi:MAG: SWIM zinc finger family protein [Cyanobacteria bacterium P01_F01_bin.150]